MARSGAVVDVALVSRARPLSDRREQLLPVLPALAGLLPGGGLPRGATVVVRPDGCGGATTLALSLTAGASVAGAWCAAAGVADVGVLALAEMGFVLERLVLVPRTGGQWAQTGALLLDGMDALVLCPPGRVAGSPARRLSARARERRVALVVLARHGPWPEAPDLELVVRRGEWEGIGRGHGHLGGRRAEVVGQGRREASRPRAVTLWLPGASGRPDPSGTTPAPTGRGAHK
ncbi:MAG: hypothetical protein ACYDA2_08025 [Acidimicrobiales bacterium]